MFFRVLGPVDVWEQGRSHAVGPWKEQTILAVLLLESGRVVSAQALAERVWDEQLPGRARETLQVYVSRLRSRLRKAGDEAGVITSSAAGGYRLNVDPDEVDVRRFQQLITGARAASAERDPHHARELLVRAEELWRGEPLEGLTGQWAESTRQALLERRRGALLARISLDLQLETDRAEAISELTELIRTGRIDQSAIEMLMGALAGSGRQDEALEMYRYARVRLGEELGVDPRPELVALHQRILRGESVAAQSTERPARRGALAPNTLDRDPPNLIGRDESVHDVLAAVAEDLAAPAGLSLYALDGMPGIGKTSVALRVAHRLASQCPDGVLQVNFRAHDPRQPPLDPRTALVLLLGALGVPSKEVGSAGSLDELAGLWRRRTRGLRLLVLFDDVRDADQIAPLMLVTAGSVVLVTSRRRLLHLSGARHLTLEALSDVATIRLLTHETGRRFPDEVRDLQRFAAHCGGLPLVVSVAAAYLRAHPTWSLADLVDRLAAPAPANGDDPLTALIYGAFELSHRDLPEPHRRLLRLMACQPVPDISLDAAAALIDDGNPATDLMLETLVEHHLLEGISRHRYRLHNLVRVFAIRRAAEEDGAANIDAAIDRMVTFYLAAAARAEHTVRPHLRTAVRVPAYPLGAALGLDQPVAAQSWLDAELENLLAIAAKTDADPPEKYAGMMACIVGPHLDRRGLWQQRVEVLNRALRAAVAVGRDDLSDPNIAQLYIHLSGAHVRTRQLDEAATYATAALEAWRAQDDRRGQADALLELGRIHWYAHRADQAIADFEASEGLYRDLRRPYGRVLADYHRAIILFERGRHADALGVAQRALAMVDRVGDSALECVVLINLAEMYRYTGQDELAGNCLQRAQQPAQLHRDPQTLAVLALNTGILSHRAGQDGAAAESLRAALELFRSIGDRGNQIEALGALTAVYRTQRAMDDACTCLLEAEQLLEQGDDPRRNAQIQLELGELLRVEQREPEARVHLDLAVDSARDASAPFEEANARQVLGDTLMSLGEPRAAREQWRQTLALYERLGHADGARLAADRLDEA